MKKMFSGVNSVMYTFLTREGKVDEAGIAAAAEMQIQAGIDGIMVLGSAGEWAYLNDEEKKRVLTAAVKAADGRVPVIAGISSFGTDQAVENMKMAQDLGAAAGLDLLAVNLPISHASVMRHYERLAAEAGMPLLYYSYPAAQHYDPTVEEYAELLGIDGIVGTKNSRMDMDFLGRLVEKMGEKGLERTILTGSSLCGYSAMKAGADGVMCPHVCHWPDKIVRMIAHCRSGEWEAARREQAELDVLLGLYGYPAMDGEKCFEMWERNVRGPVKEGGKPSPNTIAMQKEACRLLGLPVTAAVKDPVGQLTPEQAAHAEAVLRKAGLIG